MSDGATTIVRTKSGKEHRFDLEVSALDAYGLFAQVGPRRPEEWTDTEGNTVVIARSEIESVTVLAEVQ